MNASMRTHLVNVRIEALEPLPELCVLVRVIDQRVGGAKDHIHALPIGKAFEESSELGSGGFQTAVLYETIRARYLGS